MSPLVDAAVLIAAIGAVVWLAGLADRAIRLLVGIGDDPPPRHRLAGHPQPYREWVDMERPEGLSVEITERARRRWRAAAEAARLDAIGRVRVWRDGGQR